MIRDIRGTGMDVPLPTTACEKIPLLWSMIDVLSPNPILLTPSYDSSAHSGDVEAFGEYVHEVPSVHNNESDGEIEPMECTTADAEDETEKVTRNINASSWGYEAPAGGDGVDEMECTEDKEPTRVEAGGDAVDNDDEKMDCKNVGSGQNMEEAEQGAMDDAMACAEDYEADREIDEPMGDVEKVPVEGSGDGQDFEDQKMGADAVNAVECAEDGKTEQGVTCETMREEEEQKLDTKDSGDKDGCCTEKATVEDKASESLPSEHKIVEDPGSVAEAIGARGSGTAAWRGAWTRGSYENIPGPKHRFRVYCFRSPPGEMDGWVPKSRERSRPDGAVGAGKTSKEAEKKSKAKKGGGYDDEEGDDDDEEEHEVTKRKGGIQLRNWTQPIGILPFFPLFSFPFSPFFFSFFSFPTKVTGICPLDILPGNNLLTTN